MRAGRAASRGIPQGRRRPILASEAALRLPQPLVAALHRALIVAGRPILLATVINASGFLALALSDLPPMRQFGIVTSTAFVLALLADFTALPGALWILRSARDRVPL